jgi:hypothetical protein
MHSRPEWTTRRPAFSPARRGVGDIFIHHEGGGKRGIPKDKAATLREIEAYVLTKGYIAIDYNVMVFQDGDVWAGRGVENEDGATIHNNPTSVSICAVGNFDLEPATDPLIWGIWSAIHEIVASGYSSTNPNIRLHHEVFETDCPGSNLTARINDLKNWRQVPKPAPTPPAYDTGGELMHFIQVKTTGKAIAVSNGQTKNIFENETEYNHAVWLAAVQGTPNAKTVTLVDQDYWDSLPTIGK